MGASETPKRILITSWMIPPDGPVVQGLREAGYEVVVNHWHPGRNEEELRGLVPGVAAVVASTDPFTRRVLAAADSLRVISRTGVGFDSIDLAAATERGIVVATTPGTVDSAVADHAFALMLAIARRVVQNDAEVRGSSWKRFIGDDVAGATLGIVGLGNIGKQVARRALGFDMKLLAYDVQRDEEFARRHGIAYVALDYLLAHSDYVTLHAPLNAQTRNLIDERALRQMKPSAYLINTSRGGLIDETALARALREGWIAGAALDVFQNEPPWGSEVLSAPNVIFTPHVAGNTHGSQQMTMRMAVENVTRVLQGRWPVFAVNPAAAEAQGLRKESQGNL